jgi:hypothetical protein
MLNSILTFYKDLNYLNLRDILLEIIINSFKKAIYD